MGVNAVDAAHAQASHLVDINGDGIDDFLYPGSSDWMVAFGLPSGGFGTPVSTGIPDGSNYKWALTADINGDGRMDLLIPGTNSWTLWDSSGQTTANNIFTQVTNTGLGSTGFGTNSQTGKPIYEGNIMLVDHDGRGLADFMYSDGTSLYRMPNNGPNSSPQNPQFGTVQNLGPLNSLTSSSTNQENNYYEIPINFDGSARMGWLGWHLESDPFTGFYKWDALISTDTGFESAGTLGACQDTNTYPIPLNMTGGGMPDLIYVCDAGIDVDYYIEIGTGATFNPINTEITYNPNLDPLLADYYGDGRQEAILPDNTSSTGWSMVRLNYDPSSQTFIPTTTSVAAPYPSNYLQGTLHVGSIDSDGLDDYMFVEDNSGTYSWYYTLHNIPTNGDADVVTQISDGLGNTFSPQYVTLNNPASGYIEGTGSVYPVQDVDGPIWVVSSYQASDGVGGTYTKSYSYTGAEDEVTGRGYLGFASLSMNDSRNNITVTDTFNQTFPWIGDIAQQTIKQSNGDTIVSTMTNYTDQVTNLSTGKLYFPYLNNSTESDYDLQTGDLMKTKLTQTTSIDSYGHITGAEITTTDNINQLVYTTTVGASYDDTPGCIDLQTSAMVTKTTPGTKGGTMVRVVNTAPDTTNCKPLTVTVSQGNDSAFGISQLVTATPVTTKYEYDPWGNPSSVIVQDNNQNTLRETDYDFTTYYGEYPDKLTNGLGQSVLETWHQGRGVMSSKTGLNGHVTSFHHDGYGRITSIDQPDGTVINWTAPQYYSNNTLCSTVCISISSSETAGTQTIPLGTDIFDSNGRIIEQQKNMLGGAISSIVTQYDNLGRKVAVSKPTLSSWPAYWTNTNYDLLNRVIGITNPVNASDSQNKQDVTYSYVNYSTTVVSQRLRSQIL